MTTSTTTTTATYTSTHPANKRTHSKPLPETEKSSATLHEQPSALDQETLYTPWRLAFYDWWVLGVVASYGWRCDTAHYLIPLFRDNVGKNHLDIGVGTGYYLKQCDVPKSTNLTLVDNEQGALDIARQRSGRTDARGVLADVLRPLPLNDKFDTVSMYYLLHCIRASVEDKCKIFSHIKRNMTPDGVIHGANVLGKGVADDNFFGAFIRKKITEHGIFSNQDDNAYDFEHALKTNFKKVETRVVGSVFIFRAEGPRLDD